MRGVCPVIPSFDGTSCDGAGCFMRSSRYTETTPHVQKGGEVHDISKQSDTAFLELSVP